MKPLVLGFGAVAAAAGIALSIPLPACSSCTDIGCIPNVTINLEHPLTESGQYQVDFVADDKTMICRVKVPSSTSPDCTDDRVYVYQERGKGILWLSVDGKLKEVSVTITRDDAPVTDQSFSPKYEDTELNGPGCGTCPAAAETLTIE
jgi:hypothetical protein